jgi:penicillin G amidase
VEKDVKRFLRLLRNLVILSVVAGLVVSGGLWLAVQRTLPQTSGTLSVNGLKSSVEVIRDTWGVPHVYAQNADDLFFAQGYVMAQDRLWQMEFNRHVAAGRVSEFGGKATLKDDILLRALGLHRTAEADVQKLDVASKLALEAFARGVNAFADTHRDRLPLEFTLLGAAGATIYWEPWTPTDTVAIGKVMALALSMNMRIELFRSQMYAQLGTAKAAEPEPGYPASGPFIVEAAGAGQGAALATDSAATATAELESDATAAIDDLAQTWQRVLYMAQAGRLPDGGEDSFPFSAIGSNNWVVAGAKTTTGKPLLANDPHLGIQNPSVWYEVHLEAPNLRLAGVTFVGVPGIVLGHNDRIAWGATNAEVDVQDLYVEKLNPANPHQYEYQGKWVDGQVWREEIRLRGEDAPVIKEILVTRHGPIITEGVSDRITDQVALRWTIQDAGTLLQSVTMLWTARNWQDFQAAMKLWDVPAQNIVYADVDGNIGYQLPGRIPIRAKGDGSAPVPGWAGDYEWTGFIPYGDLPQAYNPADNVLASANNRIVSYSYKYFLSNEWAPPYRAQRIIELLKAKPLLSAQDLRNIQADVYSIPDREFAPYLVALAPADDNERQAIDLIKAWDYRTSTDSVAASLVETTLAYAMRYTFGDELGKLTNDYLDNGVPVLLRILPDERNVWFDDVTTSARETRGDILQRSLTDALADISKRLGKDMKTWTWGRLHQAVFTHQALGTLPILDRVFNVGPVAVPGSGGNGFTVYAANHNLARLYKIGNISSMRAIYDLGNFDNSLMVNSVGQSGQPGSKHYGDQVAAWRDVAHHAMPFSRAAVEQYKDAVLTLLPS